jgi:hypothetical protein
MRWLGKVSTGRKLGKLVQKHGQKNNGCCSRGTKKASKRENETVTVTNLQLGLKCMLLDGGQEKTANGKVGAQNSDPFMLYMTCT